MPLVATLISHPADAALSQELANMASAALGASSPTWLAQRIACDLFPPQEAEAAAVTSELRRVLDGSPIDIAVQPLANRRKKILIADMDSTMIDQECIDELADEIGIKDRVAAITARTMNGEIAFEPALRERVALLRDISLDVIDGIIENRLTLASGSRALVQTMRKNGAWTALVSGGFDIFTGRIAEKLGFHEHRANRLIDARGRLSGEVAEPILGRQAKAAALQEIAARLHLTPADAVAVGDGANDLDMLRLAGAGVALHAKPSVAAAAGLRIDHGDLTAILYMQGYSQAEFAG
jgi:phosphoserine phosphatase